MTTPFEAIVSIARIILRHRGQWQGPATAHADIDLAVNQASDLIPNPSATRCDLAILELKRCAGFTS